MVDRHISLWAMVGKGGHGLLVLVLILLFMLIFELDLEDIVEVAIVN